RIALWRARQFRLFRRFTHTASHRSTSGKPTRLLPPEYGLLGRYIDLSERGVHCGASKRLPYCEFYFPSSTESPFLPFTSRFLTLRQSDGSTASGTDREVATSTTP